MTTKTTNMYTSYVPGNGIQIGEGVSSFYTADASAGTSGWQSCEQLNGDSRQTKAADVFALGCVIFWVISGGQHPFGSTDKPKASRPGSRRALVC